MRRNQLTAGHVYAHRTRPGDMSRPVRVLDTTRLWLVETRNRFTVSPHTTYRGSLVYTEIGHGILAVQPSDHFGEKYEDAFGEPGRQAVDALELPTLADDPTEAAAQVRAFAESLPKGLELVPLNPSHVVALFDEVEAADAEAARIAEEKRAKQREDHARRLAAYSDLADRAQALGVAVWRDSTDRHAMAISLDDLARLLGLAERP